MTSPTGPPGSSPYYGSGGSSGSDPGANGYGSAQSSATSGAKRTQMVLLAASQQASVGLAGFFAPSATLREQTARSLTLWEQAAIALHQGDQKRALALYYAHLVADGVDATKSLANVDYSRLLKRPVWCIRFGVSVHPRVPDALANDPEPIRVGMKVTSPMVRSRLPAGTDPGQAALVPVVAPVSSEFNNGLQNNSGATKVVTVLGGSATADVKETLDRNLGLVAEITAAMFASRQSSGKFGRAFEGMEEAGAELASLRGNSDYTSPSDLPMWIPGVDFVGEGSFTDMLAIAKKSELDMLLHFDVIVKENRTGSPSYTTRCKLLHVETGETIGLSKSIDKFEIASGTSGVREAVQAQLTNLFEIIDKKSSVEPLPALQASHATARIDSLLASNKAGTLRSLAEIVMFRSRALITSDQLDHIFYFAGGENTLALLHEEIVGRYQTVKARIDMELNTEESP